MNQFTQTWYVDDYVQSDVFRTFKTMEQVKYDLKDDGYITDGEWSDDGQVTVVFSNIADNPHGDINRVRTFAKGFKCDFGEKGYHTLDEILEADLAYVKGYGFVEDEEDFKRKFKENAQKK